MRTRIVICSVMFAIGVPLMSGCEQKPVPPPPPSASAVAEANRWDALNVEVPKLSAFLQSRIEFSSQRRAQLSPDQLAGLNNAMAAYSESQEKWSEAERMFLSGKVTTAVEVGEVARAKAREGLLALGIDPG